MNYLNIILTTNILKLLLLIMLLLLMTLCAYSWSIIRVITFSLNHCGMAFKIKIRERGIYRVYESCDLLHSISLFSCQQQEQFNNISSFVIDFSNTILPHVSNILLFCLSLAHTLAFDQGYFQ